MSSEELQSVMDIMMRMIEAENAVSDFYQACAEEFCQNECFWKELADEESVHAEMLSRITTTVKKRPEEFHIGKVSPLSVISSFILGLKADTHKLHSGLLDDDGAIYRAFHIESVFIEEKFMHAVVTENKKYLGVLNQLQAAEVEHKSKIAKRMKRHKSYEAPELNPQTGSINS